MKSDNYVITEEGHKKFFDDVLERVKELNLNATSSLISDHIAANQQIANFVVSTRELIENEAILTVDAMMLAFEKKDEALKQLRLTTKEVESFVNYTNRSISNININIVAIKTLNDEIKNLNENLDKFKSLIDSGVFEKASKLLTIKD